MQITLMIRPVNNDDFEGVAAVVGDTVVSIMIFFVGDFVNSKVVWRKQISTARI